MKLGVAPIHEAGLLFESPLAVAVKKGNYPLWKALQTAMLKIYSNGTIFDLEQTYIVSATGRKLKESSYLNHAAKALEV